ncbi:MAG TPA: transcription termination factor Rho, partial [Clostridia bacterium]|nr:transcription termination factor Rho [Clostridia bacterium]
TSRMTKQQLIDFLTRMAEESPLGEEKPEPDMVAEAAEVQETAPKSPAKKTRAVKAAPEEPEAEADPAQEEKSEDKPKEKKAKVTSRKTSPRKTSKSADKAKGESTEDKTDEASAADLTDEPPSEEESEDKQEEKAKEFVTGVLEVMPEGYGFLRIENYIQSSRDIYVPPQYIRRFNLRTGDLINGPVRQQRDNDRYRALYYIREVNDQAPEKMIRRPHFDRLTPIYPKERYSLETIREELSTRVIDLVCPIGKGQRGMIVSPPKAGKTILLQKIANAITINNPDAKLIVLLIDERPEEVTDMQRSIDGEVVYSTFDKTPENHVRITELVLERAMRLVELGQDVVILLDSVTRMGRAYNLTINPTGRTLSGGLDPGALYGPKRFFGAARNIENGGSLTIIATALIETGSR